MRLVWRSPAAETDGAGTKSRLQRNNCGHGSCDGGTAGAVMDGFLASFGLLFAKKKFKTPPKGDIPLNTEIPISVDNTLRPRDRNLAL